MTRRVAFLGPEGTFTAEAASLAAPAAQRSPQVTIRDVVAAVRDGDADLGVVPLENSIEGSVNLTLDELAFGPPGVYVRAEILVPITMNLLCRPDSELDKIRAVRSQPHALAQCRGWLERHLPGADLQAATSTAAAARDVSESDGSLAALGTRLAAERYGLEVVAAQIQDHAGNTTRFAVLSRALAPASGADKTSMVVFFGEDRPGLLAHILQEFSLRGINLTKIESRPTKQQLGEYCIFLDAAGHLADARMGEALRSVSRHVAEVRVLGSYSRADGVREEASPADAEVAYRTAGSWYERLVGDIEPDPSP